MLRRKLAVLGLVLLGSRAQLAQADPIGPEFLISQTEAGDPWYHWEPQVAYGSSSNQYLVVWRGYNGSDNDILARMVGDSASQFPIADSSGEERYPDVAYNPDEDEYLVVYVQTIQTNKNGRAKGTGSHVVRGQRVAGDGEVIETLNLSDATSDTVTHSRVAYNTTAKKYLVAWQVYDRGRKGRTAPRGSVRGACIGIDTSGSATVGSVNTYAAYGYQGPVDLAADSANGRFLVVFQGDNGTSGVYGRLADADSGDPIGPGPFLVASGGETRSVAYGDGLYLVALYEHSSDGTHQFKGRLVDSDGTSLGDDAFAVFGPVTQGDVTEFGMAVEYDSTNELFLVAWSFDPSADGVLKRHVYGRAVAGDGSMPASAFVISDTGNNLSPALAFNTEDASFLIVWSDADTDYTGTILGVHWSLD